MKTILSLLLVASPALAQEFAAEGEVRIASHEVSVDIHDRLAATTVTQVFQNVSSTVREGTYTFAVPHGASIVEFQMWIGGRLMKGEMLERTKAEEVYQTICRKRVDPGILDHVRDNVWRVRVFPIPAAGGEMKFETRYVQVLPSRGGQITYTHPLTIPEEKAQKMDRFEIAVQVHSALPVAAIESPVSVARKSDREFAAKGDRSNVAFQKDFVLSYRTKGEGLELTLRAHRTAKDDGYFLLSAWPDLDKASVDRLPREVIYLVDASGSIEDRLFKRIAASLGTVMRDLPAIDKFNVIAFNTEAQRFQKEAVEVNPANLKAAAAFLEKIRPQGRTNFDAALEAAFATKATRPRVVFLISDGVASAGRVSTMEIVHRVVDAIDGNTVICAVPVGQASIRALETLGERTDGTCMPAEAEGIEKTLRAAHVKFSRPVLSDLKIDFGGAAAAHVHAPRILFADEPVLVSGRYRKAGTHEVTLTGRLGEREVKVTRSLEFPEEEKSWAMTAYAWAAREIAALQSQAMLRGELPEITEAIIALSRDYRIATPYTAFLVLENEEMYAQYGLERTHAPDRVLFKSKAPKKKSEGGLEGLPRLTEPVLDVMGRTADGPLLSALRWLARNPDRFKGYTSGDFAVSEAGVTALSLRALVMGDVYVLNDQDRADFERAVGAAMETFRKAQRSDGLIGKTAYDHILAMEALGLVIRWNAAGVTEKEMLQKAVAWISDQKGLFDKKGMAAMAAPGLVLARDLGLEVDAATLKQLGESPETGSDVFYLRGRMALDPKAHREEKVLSCVKRILEKGPTDPIMTFLATDALLSWRGDGTPEWKAWLRKLEGLSRIEGDGSWLPKGWKEEGRSTATVLRALLLEAKDRRKD